MARSYKLTFLAAAFMLAAAGMATAAPAADMTAQAQPAAKKTSTAQVHAMIEKMAGKDYRDFVDEMRALESAVRGDRELTRFAISEFPNLIKTAKMQDHTPWNEVELFLESLNRDYPGVYDEAVEASFKDFISEYIAQSVGATGREMEDRLYRFSVVSMRNKGLTALEVEKLPQLLSLNASGNTWLSVLQIYQGINERSPGVYNEQTARALSPHLTSLLPFLQSDKAEVRANVAYLIGNFAQAAPRLEDRVLQALAPLLSDDAIVVRKTLDPFYGIVEKNPAGAAKILALVEPLADKAASLDPEVASTLSYVIGNAAQADPVNLGTRAIDALEKISAAAESHAALGSITVFAMKNEAFAPRARAIMDNAARQYDDERAREARHSLVNLAETYPKSPEYADAAIAVLAEALAKNPLDYNAAYQISELGSKFTGKTDEVIAILRPILEAGSELAQDDRLISSVARLGFKDKGARSVEVIDMLDKSMIACAGKGDVDSVTNIAAVLKDLKSYAERLQRPAPARPGLPKL